MNIHQTQYCLRQFNYSEFVGYFLVFLLVSLTSCNKDDGFISDTGLCLVEVNGTFQEATLDEEPDYIDGGFENFYLDIQSVLNYPAEARENSIEGICLVRYEITASGTVANIVVTQNPGGGIGDATISALEATTTGTPFKPGVLNGYL